MLSKSLSITPFASLSRAVCGTRGSTLIINLPGSPKAVVENLEAISSSLRHALTLLNPTLGVTSHEPPNKVHEQEGHSQSHEHKHERREHKMEAQEKHKKHSHGHTCSHGDEGQQENPLRSSKWPRVEMEEAFKLVKSHWKAKGTQLLPLLSSLGRVLSEDVRARDPLPPFRASMKDGYAVFSEEGPGRYKCPFLLKAGSEGSEKLSKGTIIKIATGAALPEGADAVVMVEYTKLVETTPEGEIVEIMYGVKSGENVRPVGCDISMEEVVLKKGDVIGSAEIGILASVGVTEVSVYEMPKVALLSTGDELVLPNEKNLPSGKIRDSNKSMLLSMLAEVCISKFAFLMYQVPFFLEGGC